MRKNYHLAILPALFFWSFGFAQIGQIAVGSRAHSLAGNHTAVANDLTAAYWNPAALAYLPVREFQASFDGLRTYGSSDATGRAVTVPSGAKMDDYRDRIRLSGAGAMTAIPTTQGGLTLAVAYERPIALDELSVYEYVIRDTAVSESVVRYGDINRWSGAFGVQVAERIAAGFAISVITGEVVTVFDQKKGGEPYNDEEMYHYYLGYALSGGALCVLTDYLKLGLKLNATMDLGVKENRYINFYEAESLWGGEYRAMGRAYTAPNGSLGVGLTLPWLIAALDIRATMPYTFVLTGENIPEGVQAKYFKVGAGAGIEAPIPKVPAMVLRAGYSLDEHDLFPVVHKMEDADIDWESMRAFSVDGNRHTLAAGIGFFTAGTGVELSYSYQTWGMQHKNSERKLKQTYSNHRGMAAVIFRY